MTQKVFRIGTRKSQLALIQAEIVCAALRHYHPGIVFEIVTLDTTGDRIKDRSLADIGGKGLFTQEIEQALLAHDIDLAVHSLKDMETTYQQTGLFIGAVLPREDYRDILLSHGGKSLDNLPAGAKIGTCSPRRAVQVQRIRKDLVVTPLRGNVDTRLKKLEQGEVDALILAVAGLKRLGFPLTLPSPQGGEGRVRGNILEPPHFLPAVGQGVLALQIRQDDLLLARLVTPLNDMATALCVEQERAMLAHLGGNCNTPIAGLATLREKTISLQGFLASPDGSTIFQCSISLPQEQASGLGEQAAWQLLKMQELCL